MPFGFRSRKGGGDPPIAPVASSTSSDPNELNEKNIIQPEHEQLNDEQAARRLRLFREAAANDPNIDVDDLGEVDEAVMGHQVTRENQLVDELVENSPYPEVRSDVPVLSNTADPSTPRCAQPFATTTWTSLPTPSVPGSSACS